MGMWLFALYEGRRTPLHPVLGPVERGFYKLAGIDPNAEQSWRRYAVHMLLFQLVTLLLFTYVILRAAGFLPLNPRGLAGIGARRRDQHRDQLHHQHQLAMVFGRGRPCRTSARCWG